MKALLLPFALPKRAPSLLFSLAPRFVRKLSEGDVAEVEVEAERRSALGELHADEFNPYGQAYVQAEEA